MKKFNKSGKGKIIAVVLIGFFLFSGSMMVLFDFQPVKIVKGSPNEFIKVKDGMFSFLDKRGYNFQFQCEINQILLIESEQRISENQFVMISNNSFGRTVFTFDYLQDGSVKFTINHKGNMFRDYWFRITVKNTGVDLLSEKSFLVWETGYFDYSDMSVLDNFWLDQSQNNYWLSVKFYSSRNFFIDPVLTPVVLVGDVNIDVYDKFNLNDSDYYDDALAYYNFEEGECAERMISYWKFDNGSGTTAIDELDNYNGSIEYTEWSSDTYDGGAGYSLDFENDNILESGRLLNAGFENGDDGNWTLLNATFGATARTGSWGIGINVWDGITRMEGYVEQNVSIPTNLIDNITFWCRDYNSFDFNITVYYTDGTNDSDQQNLNGYTSYLPFVFTGFDADKIINKIRIGRKNDYEPNTQSAAYFDDVYVYFNHLSYVNITDNDDFTFGLGGVDQVFGFSTWIKPESYLTDLNVIISKYNHNITSNREWLVYINNSRLNFLLFDSNGDNISIISDDVLNIGEWAWITCLYNGNESESGLSLYINGISSNGVRSGSNYDGMSNTNIDVIIGSSLIYDTNDVIWGFDGLIDDFRVWNRTFTEEEITTIWILGFDYVVDSSGNNLNGVSGELYGDPPLIHGSDTYNTSRSSYYAKGTVGSGINEFWNTERINVELTSDELFFGNETDGATTNQAFSIGFWFYIGDTDHDDGAIVSKCDGDWNVFGDPYEFQLMLTNKRLQLFIGNGTEGGAFIYCRLNIANSINTWYFIVVTYNGGMDYTDIDWYRNGVVEVEDGWNTGVLSPFDNMDINMTIGSTTYISGDALHDNTRLDDISIWSGELTKFDIDYMYNMQNTYLLTDSENNVVGENYAYLTNGSNQVKYKINYTILDDVEIDFNSIGIVENYHQFYIPSNYSFVNVTLPNNTVRTVENGFSISSFNSTHDLVNMTGDGENGNYMWFFFTPNVVVYFEIDPNIDDGLLVNTTGIAYYIRIANDTEGLVNYPVNISIKNTDEEVLTIQSKLTGVDGWLNSTINASWQMTDDKKLHVCVFGLNATFMGYMTKYITSYQDFDAPTIIQMVFDETIIEKYPFILTVTIDDDYTETEDLTVFMNYGFISSGSLPEIAVLSYEAGVYVLQISGQVAETTIYFEVFVEDNLSNSYTSPVFSSDWEEAAPEGSPPDGDNDATPPPVLTPSGDTNLPIILVFLAGAGMVAILGYAVFKRVTVRTRKVETREVTTGIGGYGKTTERIEEKGG